MVAEATEVIAIAKENDAKRKAAQEAVQQGDWNAVLTGKKATKPD